MGGRIMVATDGRDGAVGALHLALSLARRDWEPALVLAVQEPVMLYDLEAPGEMAGVRLELERTGAARLREAVEAQLRELGAEASKWEVRVEVGSPPAVIADAAREHGISLILLGLGRHAPADRWLGGETVLRVMHLADVPVLAAHPDARSLPRRVLVAEDFSDFSRMAGALAAELLEPGGELHVAHVVGVPMDGGTAFATYNWIDHYLQEIEELLRARRHALATSGIGAIRTHTVPGPPAAQLLRLAEETGADLVAAGSHGRGFVGRLLMGSVSTALVRRAKCSVLVVPSSAESAG